MQDFASSKAKSQGRLRRQRTRTIMITALVTTLILLAGAGAGYFFFASMQPKAEPALSAAGPESTATQTESVFLDESISGKIRLNLRQLAQSERLAKVIDREAMPERKISLTLDGMLAEETMQAILTLLRQHGMTATFFVSGAQAVQSPQVVRAILKEGHALGNYTMRALTHMETMEQGEIVEDLTCAGELLSQLVGEVPTRVKANATEYTPEWLRAAYVSGLTEAVLSTEMLTYHSFTAMEQVQRFVDDLPYESIVSIKLSGRLESSEYRGKEVIEEPALDLQPGAETAETTEPPTLTNDERLLRMVEWLLGAIENAKFSAETVNLRQANQGKLEAPLTKLYTTEPAVGYAFFGLERVDELASILSALIMEDSVGTFFVTADEIRAKPNQIQMLIQAKQAIGIAIYPKEGADFHAICYELLEGRKLLEEQGYYGTRMAYQPFGEPSEALMEAASAMDLQIAHCDFSFAREHNRLAKTAQEVLTSIYKENTYGLQRGLSICFRMNFFDRSGLLGELIIALRETRNAYEVRDLFLLWNSTEGIYSYPLDAEQILPEVQDRIHRGQLRTDELMDKVYSHYIGNPDIASRAQLPGFNNQEIGRINTAGKIANQDRAAFLTFDDWGTDVNITALLGVLEKHGVKATFCVRTQYVPDNPNLLRAIAAAGHEIISHSHTHLPLANDPENSWRFVELMDEEAGALASDIETSYQTLQSIVGDVQLENGRPALTRLFRPPTMAVGRKGLQTVFDCGFTYIVNGSYTTRDYAAKSADALARSLFSRVRAGDVVIMHMSDNSIYTAQALDLFLTENASRADKDRLHFARLSDYLGK